MKSFKEILGEVAQPKPEEERAFKDMHSYETMPHPVALDHQFTGEITGVGDSQRIADQKGDAAYDTAYDDAMEYIGPSFDESVELDEAEDLQELSVGTLAKYVQKKVGKNARDSEALKAYYALAKTDAFKKLNKADKEQAMKLIKGQEAKVKKAEKNINLAKLKATANADKLGINIFFGKDGKSMAGSKLAESNLDEASASVYKDMPKAPGKMISNRVQVKAFKDSNAMGAFLSKQNDNSWQQTGVPGLKSGKYKIDMVKKGGKPSKNFIRVNEEVELDMDYREQADQAIINRLEEKAVERKDYNPYAKSTKRAVQHANAQKEIAKARNDAVKVGREVPTRRELENQRDKK